MPRNAKVARDAFSFSLGGLPTIASFVIAPAIADDRLNKVRDDRLKQVQSDQPDQSRDNDRAKKRGLWPLRLRRAT